MKFQKATMIKIVPGCFMCILIAAAAQGISCFVPTVGSALFAIGIGIICGNTILTSEKLSIGTKFSESRLLEYSIVLTGFTLHLSDIAGVGFFGVFYIIVQMTLTITIAYMIGRKLGFGKKFSLLMSAGNAVCGSSAIGTVSPIVDADSKDKGLSITIVNVTGTFLMIILPVLSGIIYHNETMKTSGLIGGTLQSIGQVIASAKFVNDDVVKMATIFKIIRIVFLVGVAFVFSKMNLEDNTPLFKKERKTKIARISCKVPWFILGFFLLSILNSFGMIPEPISRVAKLVSGQFEIIALAAIGMRVKFKDLMKEGPRGMLYGGIVGMFQTVCAIILIAVLFH